MRVVNRPKSSPKSSRKSSKGLKVAKVDEYMRFVLFLALIGMVYIWNSHLAEKQVKEMTQLEAEVKTLKSQYLEKAANLSAGTQFATIKDKVDSLGLYKYKDVVYQLTKQANE